MQLPDSLHEGCDSDGSFCLIVMSVEAAALESGSAPSLDVF